MQKYILIGVLLLALAGGYFIYSGTSAVTTPNREAPETGTRSSAVVAGVVTDVDLDEVALDGPALITIEDAAGTEHTIAVPSMGILLCAAHERIADPFTIEPGDTLEVRGTRDEDGRIVPCEDPEDHLRVAKTYTNDTLGFSFTYPDGKTGYVFEDDLSDFSEHPNFVYGIMLTDAKEYEEFHAATDAREGPPTIQIRIFENVDRLSPAVWVDRNPLESNVEMAFNEPEEVVVAGANAVHYVADGLYATEYYVVAHGGYIYLLIGMYLDTDSDIARDYDSLVDSFTFVPTDEQLEGGT